MESVADLVQLLAVVGHTLNQVLHHNVFHKSYLPKLSVEKFYLS